MTISEVMNKLEREDGKMLEENETVEETEILGVEGLNWSR